MHDDTVAKRLASSGGLVPGVDVMAYMMHLPVAKWGRAFLERGLIEARFVKPVYDGEMADVTRRREQTACSAIQVESRGELCATGSASLPAAAPSIFAFATLSRSRRLRSASRWMRRPMSSANGSARCRAPGRRRGQGISGGYSRNRSDLRPGRPRPSRPVAAGDEQGAGRQRHHGSLDSRRHPDAASVRAPAPATN